MITFEGRRPNGEKMIIRKRVFMLRNLDSLVQRIRYSCDTWEGFHPVKKEKDSHQR